MRRMMLFLMFLFSGLLILGLNPQPADALDADCPGTCGPWSACTRNRIYVFATCTNRANYCCAPNPVCEAQTANDPGNTYRCIPAIDCTTNRYYSGALCNNITDVCCATNPIPTRPVTCADDRGIPTAIGCIDLFGNANPGIPLGSRKTDANIFVGRVLRLLTGMAGGIAFLLMLFGTIRIMTSAGDPKGIQAGKELVTSAIVGLLFIIFSAYLLKIIGFDILGLPGFIK